MSSPEKGKARENPARARMVVRKAKRVTLGKVTENRKWNTRALMVSVADCWYKQQHKPQGKGKGTGKAKSNVPEISESDASKQAEETWSPNTSLQPSSLSQVNAIGEIGRTNDGLWIFSAEDSQKREYSVNWTMWTNDLIDSGCYGHVCPPWFAPQFPSVSSSNVEAVAANSEALRHKRQKVVYGHMTTNSGRRVLIQITFDVMSVRKPLLSTSALKRRGETIIFNHDYDRIIFRNETVNLISHDCHSYLCLTLANGIPHRKAMVMAGENVSNDVDEEVYVGDGVMGHEAHNASGGDRRAIADADQAGTA